MIAKRRLQHIFIAVLVKRTMLFIALQTAGVIILRFIGVDYVGSVLSNLTYRSTKGNVTTNKSVATLNTIRLR